MVRLQSIATIPVAATFNKRFCSVYVLLYTYSIPEKDADADDGKDEVNLGAENTGLLEKGFIRGEGFLLDEHDSSVYGSWTKPD